MDINDSVVLIVVLIAGEFAESRQVSQEVEFPSSSRATSHDSPWPQGSPWNSSVR